MAEQRVPKAKREFAVEHSDGSVSDIELWDDILDEDDMKEIREIKAQRKEE